MLSYLLFYQISSLVNFISSITLSMLIFFRSSNNLRNRIFAYFCLSVGFWSLIYFLWLGATNQIMSDYLLRTCMIGVFFMPTLFIHFIVRFLEVKNRNVFLFVNYALSLFFAVFVYSPLYASDSAPFLIFNYWLKGNILCTLEIIHFVIVVLYSFFLMFRAFNNSTGVKRNQLLYIMVGTGVGYLCGAVNFFSWYRIPVPPFLNIFITFYVVLVAYAIIKYGLMDVRLAITNFSIFIGVYAFVLGFPFYFYAIGQKLFALFCMLVFATAGPFIYFYIQKRAEDKILEDQRRYQDTLRKAAAAMNRIKDVKKLFNLIVELITSGMRVDFTLVYVLDPHAKEYSLQAFKYIRSQSNMIDKISADSPLVGYLEGYHGAVTYDDMHHNPEVSQKFTKVSVIRALGELRFKDVLILPVLIEGKALAMIVLGKKQNGRIFTKDDLSVLSTLANQVALSVENCHYWVAETKRMEEQGLRERVASLDMMASSLAHEIDNPNNIIINQADFVIELLEDNPQVSMAQEIKDEVRKSLNYVIDSSKRVSNMIQAILEYSRMGTGELRPVKIEAAIDSFLQIINPQIKKEKADFRQDIAANLPVVVGDKVQLEEIFMNFTINSLHAVRHNDAEKLLILKVYQKDADTVRIEFSDNGYGIPAHMLEDIFLASVTTKGSVEGTGLGLYRIRKIVDSYKGKVWAESDGKGKGARFIVELPVYKGDESVNNGHEDVKPKSRKAF